MRMIKWVVPAFALALLAVACAPPPPAPLVWSPVPYGMIKTEGVVIESDTEREKFVLRSGERFAPPFDVPFAWGSWTGLALPDAGTYRQCGGGCRKVRVTVPGRSDKLYGLLYFSQMHPAARGPGTRSYLIQIPQNYVDEARDGRVSVIYETVSHRFPSNSQTGWILWLSDMPFTDCPAPC